MRKEDVLNRRSGVGAAIVMETGLVWIGKNLNVTHGSVDNRLFDCQKRLGAVALRLDGATWV